MYYVVRLAGINQREKHHVFPVPWMRNSEAMLQRFVKNRINRNQVHIFFWSNEKNDDGEPNTIVEPNFNLPIQKVFPPTVNGCFFGQPVSFWCKYIDAVAEQNRLRNVEPAVYNARQLTEAPLPDLNQNIVEQNLENANANNIVEPNLENAHANNNIEPNLENIENQGHGDSVVSSSLDDLNNTNDVSSNQKDDVSSSNSVSCSENEEKPELHLLQRADLAEINAILYAEISDSEEDGAEGAIGGKSDDEVEIILLGSIFPQPVQYSCDGLIKRDEDTISGNLAYADAPQVC